MLGGAIGERVLRCDILTSFLLELVGYPAICQIWKWHADAKHEAAAEPRMALATAGD